MAALLAGTTATVSGSECAHLPWLGRGPCRSRDAMSERNAQVEGKGQSNFIALYNYNHISVAPPK